MLVGNRCRQLASSAIWMSGSALAADPATEDSPARAGSAIPLTWLELRVIEGHLNANLIAQQRSGVAVDHRDL